jgi:hypothetical protein
MTIVGKILVLVNLVFALATGGFLIFDFATRSNWRAGYAKLDKELQVSRANTAALEEDRKKFTDEMKKATDDRDAVQAKLAALQKQYKDDLDAEKRKTAEEVQKARTSDVNHKRSTAEAESLREENKRLLTVIESRDQRILAQEKDIANYRNQAVASENAARSSQARNENLVQQIEQLSQKLVKMQTGAGAAGAASVRDPNYRNPPPAFVKGIITKVDESDPGLVEISVGSDAGVNMDNTLEVYRLKPRPEYLGTIRIVDAHHQKAIGRLVKSDSSPRRVRLQKGDEVASKIQDR